MILNIKPKTENGSLQDLLGFQVLNKDYWQHGLFSPERLTHYCGKIIKEAEDINNLPFVN